MEPFMELSGPRTAGDNDKIGPIRRDGGWVTWSAANANFPIVAEGHSGGAVCTGGALELQKARDLFIVRRLVGLGFIVCGTVALGVANLL
jgi:hypothetical protein